MGLLEKYFGPLADQNAEESERLERMRERFSSEAQFVRCGYMKEFEKWLMFEVDSHDGPGTLEQMNYLAGYRSAMKTTIAKINSLRQTVSEVE